LIASDKQPLIQSTQNKMCGLFTDG